MLAALETDLPMGGELLPAGEANAPRQRLAVVFVLIRAGGFSAIVPSTVYKTSRSTRAFQGVRLDFLKERNPENRATPFPARVRSHQ